MFPCEALLFYVTHEVFIEVPLFKKPVLPPKISVCAPVALILTFHPNFHSILWLFANLLIYRILIHSNISLIYCFYF